MSVSGITQTTQFLTFYLDKEVFGIDISRIKEVLEMTELTRIPRVPEFMSGVINLRGSVVPVVDLRLKFGMSKSVKTVNTCIIIIDVTQEDGTKVIGAVADSVKEVMELDPSLIEQAPKVGKGLRTDFILGMGRQHDHFVILLDTDKIFSASELQVLEKAGGLGQNSGERAA